MPCSVHFQFFEENVTLVVKGLTDRMVWIAFDEEVAFKRIFELQLNRVDYGLEIQRFLFYNNFN